MAKAAAEEYNLAFLPPSPFRDVIVDVLVVLKLQQLNIELLWKACGSDIPSSEAIDRMRESNVRLANSMEQIAALLSSSIHSD